MCFRFNPEGGASQCCAVWFSVHSLLNCTRVFLTVSVPWSRNLALDLLDEKMPLHVTRLLAWCSLHLRATSPQQLQPAGHRPPPRALPSRPHAAT